MYVSQLFDGRYHISAFTRAKLTRAEFDLVYRGPSYATRAEAQAAIDAIITA